GGTVAQLRGIGLRLFPCTVAVCLALGSNIGPAHAFSLLTGDVGQHPYWVYAGYSGFTCAKNSRYPSPGYVTCDIGLQTTAALQSHSGWDNTVSAAAAWWTAVDYNVPGYPNGVVAIQYDRNPPNGYGKPVTVDAADLGGYGPGGTIILGRTAWYYLPG